MGAMERGPPSIQEKRNSHISQTRTPLHGLLQTKCNPKLRVSQTVYVIGRVGLETLQPRRMLSAHPTTQSALQRAVEREAEFVQRNRLLEEDEPKPDEPSSLVDSPRDSLVLLLPAFKRGCSEKRGVPHHAPAGRKIFYM